MPWSCVTRWVESCCHRALSPPDFSDGQCMFCIYCLFCIWISYTIIAWSSHNYSLYRNWWENLCQKLADPSLMDLRSKHYLDERHTSAMSDHFMFGHHMFPETAECEALFGSAFFAEYEVTTGLSIWCRSCESHPWTGSLINEPVVVLLYISTYVLYKSIYTNIYIYI